MAAEHHPTGSQTPEQNSGNERQVSHIEGVPNFLQIEAIDELRNRQNMAVWERVQELEVGQGITNDAHAEIVTAAILQVMDTSGLNMDNPRYQQAYDFLRSISTDRIDETAWHTSVVQESTGQPLLSGRELTKRELATNFTWEAGEVEPQPIAPSEGAANLETDTQDETEPGAHPDDENPTDPETEPITSETDDDAATEEQEQLQLTPEQEAELLDLERRWNEAYDKMEADRNTYLRRRAGNARRAVHIRREFRNGSVQEARDAYEAQLAIMYQLQREALGITAEDDGFLNQEAINEQRVLAEEHRKHRLVATGNYEFNEQGELVEKQRGVIGRQLNKFYNWYGRVNAGGKMWSVGALKKMGTMAGITTVAGAAVAVPFGLLFAPVTGAVVAGVGAGALVSRVTKAYMSTHINKRSVDANDQHAELQHKELLTDFNHESNTHSMADLIDAQSKREVRRNQYRTAAVVGTTALAGVLGAWGGDFIHDRLVGSDTVGAAKASVEKPDVDPQPVPKPGEVAGFQTAVNVESGNGYIREISDLFNQKGVRLTDAQSEEAYNNLVQKFPNLRGNFFTDNPAYTRGAGDYGISRSGGAHWNDAVVRELDAWSKARNIG